MTSEIEIRIVGERDHILRHVKGTQIADGKVESVAFSLDAEGGLSFGWVEYFQASFDENVKAVIKEYCSARTIRASHRFALIPLQELRAKFSAEGLERPEVEHLPVPGINSHCEIGREYLAIRSAETILADTVRALFERE